jgi:hypothetical protein
VSYPKRHYAKGVRKERGAASRFKRSVRMFKAARNHLVESHALNRGVAPPYFIECLLYNVLNSHFKERLDDTFAEVVDWLTVTDLRGFKSQNGVVDLFGSSKDQWSVLDAQVFVRGLANLWDG